MLDWGPIKHQPQLDIVGIVAILGEGSTSRNAQASALGWHHVLPRLLPAPQALLQHEHKRRLPAAPGTVVGVFSGNIKFELNFFCQLLHKDDLDKNEVELVKVERCEERDPSTFYARLKNRFSKRRPVDGHHDSSVAEQTTDQKCRRFKADQQAYNVKRFGCLAFLSVLGCCMSVGMIVASVFVHDGAALLATVCLSVTSLIVGFASWWRLIFEEDAPQNFATPRKERAETIPDSDVVIFYPRQGAFRIVRCSETISRLYFRTEICRHIIGDNAYRVLALLASVFLMVGLLSMSNAQFSMQAAFALSYVVLNALYWGFSALNPTGRWGHWKHKYQCTPILVKSPFSEHREPTSHASHMSQDTKRSVDPRRINTWSPTSTIIKSPIEASPTHDDSAFEQLAMRQRKVTLPAANTVRENGRSSDPKSDESSIKEGTSVSWGLSKPSREQTTDLEGGKKRFVNPFGSVRDAVMRQLGKSVDGQSLKGSDQHPLEDAIPARIGRAKSWLSQNRIVNRTDPSRKVEPGTTFTTALWKVIALTGNGQWLHQTHIAPNNKVWARWIDAATEVAKPKQNDEGQWISACTISEDGRIELPVWNHQQRLKEFFDEQHILDKRRPPEARRFREVVLMMDANNATVKGISPEMNTKLRAWARRARATVEARRQRPNGTSLSAQTTQRRPKSAGSRVTTGRFVRAKRPTRK